MYCTIEISKFRCMISYRTLVRVEVIGDGVPNVGGVSEAVGTVLCLERDDARSMVT